MARKSWKSTRRRAWKASSVARSSISPASSLTTSPHKSTSPRLTCDSRLTVSRGYGVAEIHIPDGSEYVGKAIKESGLRDRDLNVLTLYRGTTVIPNPRSDRELMSGDRLLCFGKLELMRDLIPVKTRRKRRPEVHRLPESASVHDASHEVDLEDARYDQRYRDEED